MVHTRGVYFRAKNRPRPLKWRRSIGNYLLWVVILALLAFFIFYFTGWDYFQNENDDPAVMKILIVSLLLALGLVILLVWVGLL